LFISWIKILAVAKTFKNVKGGKEMRETIGELAGKVWNTLGEKGDVSLAQLPKIIKDKSEVVYQALGWLAHEGKVVYKKKNKRNIVCLTDHEKDIFKAIQ
jgi:hypothetical protein